MRRFFAFWLDITISAVISTIFTFFVVAIFEVKVPATYFYFFVLPLVHALIEVKFNGVTAGRYLFGLKLVDFDAKPVRPFILMSRCFFVFLSIPFLAFIFAFIYRFFMGEPQVSFESRLSSMLITFLNLFVFSFSLGRQIFADLLFKTVVVSQKRVEFKSYSWRAAFGSIIIGLAFSVAVFFTVGNTNSLVYKNPLTQSFLGTSQEMAKFSVDSIDLDTGTKGFNLIYAGEHTFTGLRPLSKVQEALGFWYSNGKKIVVPEIMIPSNVVRVSFKGVFNSFYMDSISKNLFLKQREETGAPASLVGFLYYERFFGIFALKIYTWRLASIDPFSNDPDPSIFVFSPETNYRVAPFFLAGVVSEQTFDDLNMMTVIEVNSLE